MAKKKKIIRIIGKTNCTQNKTVLCSALDFVNAYSLLSCAPKLPSGSSSVLLALINCRCVSSATSEPGVLMGDRKKLSAPLRVLCGMVEIGG